MKKALIITVAALAALGTAANVRQWQQRAQLQADLAIAREQADELAELRARQKQLLDAQMPAAELERLRADRAAVARLRREIETLKQSSDAKSAAAAERVEAPPSVTEGSVAEKYLRNMGRATPAAALETALWAATGGDIETLVGLLALDGEARTAAEQILAALPPLARHQYRTPEHLVALLTAKDIPLVQIKITPPRKADPAGTKVYAMLPAADGKLRNVAISLRQVGDDWKLVVPRSAVEKYDRMLKGAPTATRAN